jgi:hypothetical protein
LVPEPRQFVILKALSEYQIAVTDPSHWIKVFRYDKLKPKGVFYMVGPTQAEFCFTGEICQRLGFSQGSPLNDSASKMDYSIAARFVRVKNLQRIRDAYDVVAAIGRALDGYGQGVVPGGDVDHGELDALQSLLRQYASLYWAMMPVVCLHMVTSCVFEPEQRLTVGLYGLASILLPFWEREGLSPAEGDGIPLERRNPRSPSGMHIWAHSEEAVKKYAPTMFDLTYSMATASDYRSSAFEAMGLDHFFSFLLRLAGFDQRADVLAERAEMSLLKLLLRSSLGLPASADASTHRPAETSIGLEPLGADVVLPPLGLAFAQVKTAMTRMGVPLRLSSHVDLLPDDAPCFLDDLVRLPEEGRRAMVTSASEGLVRTAAIGQAPYHISAAQLLSV